ncbi:MAG: DUF6702 family protein [Flavobacteriaceae bacterium]
MSVTIPHFISSFLLLLVLHVFPYQSKEHKFYVSTTKVEYKPTENTLQIISQLFIDDVELLLQQTDGTIRLDPDSNSDQIDRLLEFHLKKELQIEVDDSILEMYFLGKEYKEDILVCYIEIPLSETIQNLKIRNSMLFDLYEDQQNIVHFKSMNYRKSFLFKIPMVEAAIDF